MRLHLLALLLEYRPRKSKMSFSYWGADKVTVQKPVKPRQLAANAARRGAAGTPTAYGRESSANAKFGTRLVAADSPNGAVRPASRRTQVTPAGGRRHAHSEEDHAVRATVTKATVTKERPAWVGTGSTRAATTTPTSRRPRNTSQTSAATRATTAAATAPTEEVKPTEAPAPEVTPKDPVVRTLTAAIRRVLTHTKTQETPKEEAKTEVRVAYYPFSSKCVTSFLSTLGAHPCRRCCSRRRTHRACSRG